MNEIISSMSFLPTFLIVIFSIILHEIAHGYAAYIQGDETAYRAGRLTLNPIPHIDPIGSVIVPIIGFMTAGTFFGWAKGVPYNPYNIRSKLGNAFVASAGVLTNFLIAVVAGIVFKILLINGFDGSGVYNALLLIIMANVSLGFFNLIPIPPFDGMAILQSLFPRMSIDSRFVYNPIYMVMAIIVASVLYSAIIPHIIQVVYAVLY